MKMKNYPTNTKEIIEKVESIALNAREAGAELTAAYVAYMTGCSETHAARMLQYWAGR